MFTIENLNKLDSIFNEVLKSTDVDNCIASIPIHELLSREYTNKLLQMMIFNKLSLFYSGKSDIPIILELYMYSTCKIDKLNINYCINDLSKFWNLPNLDSDRILYLILPGYQRKNIGNIDECDKLLSKLEIHKECDYIRKEINHYKELRESLVKNKQIEDEKSKILEKVEKMKFDFSKLSNINMVDTLFYLNGYKGSIRNGKKLEKLLWLSTGWYLTDIIDTITKYIKIRDEIVCTLVPDFIIPEVEFDTDIYGLGNKDVYNYYLKECKSIAKRDGRLPSDYKGYSLATLKSTEITKKEFINLNSKVKNISDYELLTFIENNLDKDFSYEEVADYLPKLKVFNISAKPKDEGDDYNGFIFESDSYYKLNRILVNYDITEFPQLRKIVSGVMNRAIEISSFSDKELSLIDCDKMADMLDILIDSSTINKNTLMSDMQWLRLCGHINISFSDYDKDNYRVLFNAVNFSRAIELIRNSDKGYLISEKLLSRLGKSNMYYKKLKSSYNIAIWELYKYTINCRVCK